jgi:hypothetical protein
MGTVSKVFNVIFRVGELCSALIVLGITGHFLWLLGEADAYADSRIILAVVTASISTAFSVFTLLPFTFAFLAFPIDFVLFVVWLTTYCLLQSLTGLNPCGSIWYYDYWGYYWGSYWWSPNVIITGPWDIDWAGCGTWRTVLAFSFISSIVYLASACLGCIVTIKLHEDRKALRLHHQTLEKSPGQPMFTNGDGAPAPLPPAGPSNPPV